MAADRMAAERLALGSLATDPLVRLQMAGINPEVRRYKLIYQFYNFTMVILCYRCPPTPTPPSTCTRTPPRPPR